MIHSKFLIHWTGKDINKYNREMTDELRKEYVEILNNDLQKGLYMSQGREKIYGKDNKCIEIKIAKVCFTEIKLTQTQEHAKRYGKLGIGFNRDFVLEREGNPVFYVQNGDKSHIIENLDFLHKFVKKYSNPIEDKMLDTLNIILGYLKNMSCRNENELKYYDEMEWRIVHIRRLEGPNNYIQNIGETTKEGEKSYRLKFNSKDVQLIVFPDNKTIQLALKDEEFSNYFNSYMPTLIALDDCKNF